MRFGGLGQLWSTVMRLVWIMFLCQLLSPLVALLAIMVSGAGTDSVMTTEVSPLSSDTTTVRPAMASDSTPSTPDTPPSECCHQSGDSHVAMCPSDHVLTPHLCQDPSVPCSSLPLWCLVCSCDYGCTYGDQSTANCSVPDNVQCQGDRAVTRDFTCSYCFLTHQHIHKCSNRDIGCRSVGSPSSSSHWYIANCTVDQDTLCLGKHVFSKRRECNWTEGYSWNTALILSVTLGGFGADRFYLGHWQEGIGKLFSFGGLGVWTLVDVVLVATGYIGPADGSLYV